MSSRARSTAGGALSRFPALLQEIPDARLPLLVGERPEALGRPEAVDRLDHGGLHGLLEHEGGVLVEVRDRPEGELVEEARDGHGEHRGLQSEVPAPHDGADRKEHAEEDDRHEEGPEAARASAVFPPEEDVGEEAKGTKGEQNADEVEKDAGNLREPRGEEVPGPEGGGADVVVQGLPAYPQIHAHPGADAAFLPFHRGDFEVWDFPAGEALLDEFIELQGRG